MAQGKGGSGGETVAHASQDSRQELPTVAQAAAYTTAVNRYRAHKHKPPLENAICSEHLRVVLHRLGYPTNTDTAASLKIALERLESSAPTIGPTVQLVETLCILLGEAPGQVDQSWRPREPRAPRQPRIRRGATSQQEDTELGMFDPVRFRSVVEETWVTRDGIIHHVVDMGDWHVKSAMRILQDWIKNEPRKSKQRDLKAWIRHFKKVDRERNASYRRRNRQGAVR